MNLALVSLSLPGAYLAKKLAAEIDGEIFVHQKWTRETQSLRCSYFERIFDLSGDIFQNFKKIVYFAPCGVVVRAIAPFLKNKLDDPAVVVVDAGARYAISLLSGHEGGANALACQVANILGAEPIITTTTEAVKDVIAGIGCRKGVQAEEIITCLHMALNKVGKKLDAVRMLSSVDLKKNESGLILAAQKLNLPLRFIPAEEIKKTNFKFNTSEFVQQKIGLPGVAEPAALLAGTRTRLILEKTICNRVTIALAQENLQ